MSAIALGDADVARTAMLIGDRTRARVLTALSDGRALPASALAAEAGVSPSTVSEHLGRLLDASLVAVERQGRARYYRLADASVAEALEAIARISPPEPITSLRQGNHAYALRYARTCYNHLAGRLGVAFMAALLDRGLLSGGDGLHHRSQADRDRLSAPGRDVTYQVTEPGHRLLGDFGVVPPDVDHAVRYCVDWSEQRHHLAGSFGSAVTTRMLDLGWIRRGTRRRAVTLTDAGRSGLRTTFGVPDDWEQLAECGPVG